MTILQQNQLLTHRVSTIHNLDCYANRFGCYILGRDGSLLVSCIHPLSNEQLTGKFQSQVTDILSHLVDCYINDVDVTSDKVKFFGARWQQLKVATR